MKSRSMTSELAIGEYNAPLARVRLRVQIPASPYFIKMIKAVIFDIGGVLVDQKLLVERFVRIFRPKNVYL